MTKCCFAKLVCDKNRNMRVIGFHVVGPEAGEITQGYATALRYVCFYCCSGRWRCVCALRACLCSAGATKQDFDDTVGIHPTTAEEFTTLSVSLSSGLPWEKKGGC